MAEKKKTYLEKQLEAVMTKEKDTYIFRFQREKINLVNGLEANVIKEVNPSFQKETVMTEDEVQISIQPPSEYKPFRHLKSKNKKSKWLFAYQLVKAVEEHSVKRLHMIAAPENIVFDKGLTPAFLHYGVKESIPPYENDEERLFNEVKAAAALAVDWEFSFEDYLKYSETMKFSDQAKDIISSETYGDLKAVIQRKIDELDAEEKTLVHLPKKKWKNQRYIGLGLIICLIPAVLFTFYSLFFIQPKQEAFIESNRYFLNKQYSKVISTLDKYGAGDMPESVQYQLAYSYASVDNYLKETNGGQEAALNLLTLQADSRYFQYFIQIGRGENKAALETARLLEDNRWIGYALIKYEQEIKADDKLSSEEREKQLEPIEKELEQVKEDQEKAKNSEEAEQTSSDQQQAAQEAEKAKQEEEKAKQAEKEKKAKDDNKKKDDK